MVPRRSFVCAAILDRTAASVFNWQKRFEADGVSGLKTKSVQRRKPLLTASDEASVRKAIENDRIRFRPQGSPELDEFSMGITKQTVLVLGNAGVHRGN